MLTLFPGDITPPEVGFFDTSDWVDSGEARFLCPVKKGLSGGLSSESWVFK